MTNTKYGDLVEDHEWTDPDPDDGGDRTHVDSHDVSVIYVTDPDENMGYGREKYEARVSYDDETGDPFVLYAIKYRWKGNYWRDTHDYDWRDIPGPVQQQIAAVLPVESAGQLDGGNRLMDEGGESRWEKIHEPRMKRMKEDGKTVCTVCGCDLEDPKNGGDPTEDDEWVCRDPHCRGFADAVTGPYSCTEEP